MQVEINRVIDEIDHYFVKTKENAPPRPFEMVWTVVKHNHMRLDRLEALIKRDHTRLARLEAAYADRHLQAARYHGPGFGRPNPYRNTPERSAAMDEALRRVQRKARSG
jgi:hypothetical protein